MHNSSSPANDSEFMGPPQDPKKRAEYYEVKYGNATRALLDRLRIYFPNFPMNKGDAQRPTTFKPFYYRTDTDGILKVVYGSCHISFPIELSDDILEIDLDNFVIEVNGKEIQLDTGLKVVPKVTQKTKGALSKLLPNLHTGTPKLTSQKVVLFNSISIQKRST